MGHSDAACTAARRSHAICTVTMTVIHTALWAGRGGFDLDQLHCVLALTYCMYTIPQ